MGRLKQFFKKNSHNNLTKALAGFGRSLNRLYENRNHDLYSNGELTVIQKLAKTDPRIVIDAGANIGKYSTVLDKELKSCKIISLEPVTKTYDLLQKNLNNQSKFKCINKGLFSENTKKKINLFSSHTHSSIYDIEGINYKPIDHTTIELIKGDDLLLNEGIDFVDFLKLDLEGAEYDALLGFKDSLAKGKIGAIQFEYGYINITSKKLLIDFYNLLEPYGYKIGKIFPKEVEFRPYLHKYEDFIGPNFIAVHQDQIKLINLLKQK